MSTISIGELARATGLSQSAIRYYESQKLLPVTSRKSGWRTFPPDVIERLQVVRIARDLGFSLREIRTLLDGFSPDTPPAARWQQLARRKLPEVEALVQRATAMKKLLEKGLRCDCISMQDCIRYDCDPPVSITRRKS